MNSEAEIEELPEIKYQRAKFSRRIFANLVDLLIFTFLGVLLFLGIRTIYQATPDYQARQDELTSMRIESGLYVEREGMLQNVVSSIDDQIDLSAAAKEDKAREVVENFIVYAATEAGSSVAEEIQADYDEFRLKKIFGGKPYFLENNGEIIVNEDCSASHAQYFENIYSPYIKERCEGFLSARFPRYVDITLYISRILVFGEIPIAYCLSGILAYYVPTWIFRRGRQTFGKALYHIGTVDARILNPTWKRSLARFLIFYFAILILSLVTFAIPALISVTMLGFSKKKQGFADYLLDLQEIDVTGTKIFNDYQEAEVSLLDNHASPVDFEMISRL